MVEYIDSREINRRMSSAVSRVSDVVLGNNHKLTDEEVHTCGRILMCIKSGVDGYERSKEKHGIPRVGGNTLRMAKDIIFLMFCLSGRSEEGEIKTRNVDLSKALDIMKEESIYGVPNLIVEEE